MPTFTDIAWLPLCAGLTVLGALGAWYAWRRRDAAAGLRAMAWALVPLAAYLTGLLRLLWDIVAAVARWATGLVFSPSVWLGMVVAAVAAVLFVAAAVLRRHRPPERAATPSAVPRAGAAAGPWGGKDDLDDFAEIEEILRRRGIT